MSEALFDSAWGTIALAIAVGCLVLLAVLVATARPRGAWLRDRLGPYKGPDGERPTEVDASWRQRMDAVFGATERRFDGTKAWRGMTRRIEQAGMETAPAKLAWLSVAAGATALVLVGLFTQSAILGLAAAALAGVIPFAVVWARARKRMHAFDAVLPDVLQTLAGSLQVGHSFNQGLQAIVDEGQQPASDEFGRVLAEMRFGRPSHEALEAMGERLASSDFDYVLMSVRVQQQVGGSLAGLFETVAETVRERQQFRRKLHAITATGRISAYMLTCLPFATAALIAVMRPEYLRPLYTTQGGQIAIAVSLVMIVLGALSLRQLVDVKG